MAVEFEWMTQSQVISEALSGCPSEVPPRSGFTSVGRVTVPDLLRRFGVEPQSKTTKSSNVNRDSHWWGLSQMLEGFNTCTYKL